MLKKLFLTFLFFILILLSCGIFHANNEEIIFKTQDKNTIEDISSQWNQIKENYPNLSCVVNKIIVTDDNLAEESKIDIGSNDGEEYVGLADQETNNIYIKAGEYESDTLLHEAIHLFDYSYNELCKNDEDEPLSLSDEYKKVIEDNINEYTEFYKPSLYHVHSYQESFVSVSMEYLKNKEGLKKVVPELYEYMSGIYDGLCR